MEKMTKILVTGSQGFIGRNLVAELRAQGYTAVLECDRNTDQDTLVQQLDECEFVFHLAGVNRPQTEAEFKEGNVNFTAALIEGLAAREEAIPVLMTSSIQVDQDNPYGVSKLQAEQVLRDYSGRTGAPVLIYRLPNVFGKWCRPNYNSVVATFCHNIARKLPIQVNNPETTLNLVYIDDVVNAFISAMQGGAKSAEQTCLVQPVYTVTLGYIVQILQSFYASRADLSVPDLQDTFVKKLYSTYLSYLPEQDFSYPLTMHKDMRGSFTEFIKTCDRGQVSINVSKPGIAKGNHWHHTKNEKFLVVSGSGLIRFRSVGGDEVIEYAVSGDKLTVVDIPPGYTHSITNIGATDLVTVMWANESFDPEKPDTIFLEVLGRE